MGIGVAGNCLHNIIFFERENNQPTLIVEFHLFEQILMQTVSNEGKFVVSGLGSVDTQMVSFVRAIN